MYFVIVSVGFFLTCIPKIKSPRLGEWGDHVTLQAAADRVSQSWILSAPVFCKTFFC